MPLLADSVYLVHDNDLPFDSDDHYSAGLQIGWMSDTYNGKMSNGFGQAYVEFLSNILELAGASFTSRKRAGTISVQEMIITPKDLTKSEPIYNDVPYMGLLSNSFSLLSWDKDDFDEYRLTIGMVGPDSGAEKLQKTVHTIVGSTDPKGWNNQLGTRVVTQLGYIHGIKQFMGSYKHSQRFEWFNSYYADVGNFYCGAGVGSSIRYGHNMPYNFESVSGLFNSSKGDMIELDQKNSSIGWDIHGGVHLNAIAYLYLYDESKRFGYSYERPYFLPIVNFGVSWYMKNFSLAIDFFPSQPTVANPQSASFARINLSLQFN
ncbi:lipid A deacylase LpxR family protein [Sulfurimonas sp. HSL3-2]|uniref:lipid A deacylase LpxR family protein n=1 Tax=Hydrocurvibacter mobilis TaxID=3131936 RepID=UPI0031F9F5D4